jgi:class 3 adenylate cyclase
MEKDRLSRKLAVILHADVVGSTSLVQKNETLAHERIQSVFRRFSDTIEAYGGITLELRGDALVAEFNRASDCVAASLAFQVVNSELNATLGDDIQPQLRIGTLEGNYLSSLYTYHQEESFPIQQSSTWLAIT